MDYVPTSQPSQDGYYIPGPCDTSRSAGPVAVEDFEFVASSQPSEDGEVEDDWDVQGYLRPMTPPAKRHLLDALELATTEPLSTVDLTNHIAASDSTVLSVVDILPHPRRRLIRRASPMKLKTTPSCTQPTISRPNPKLVRRVTMAAHIARQQERAREETRRILKKIRRLATATARLRQKHRRLCEFMAESRAIQQKENIFT
ncbi:hypothetical protein C8R44DRAFT_984335 [Mycena epipterygia]|nr:hypothetical protein C8R44DRAFT_984335 [Mycena epipterygia]